MHLLEAEGEHAVDVGVVGVGRQRGFGDAQHRGRVAAVEAEVLVQLHRREVGRMLLDDGVADALHGCDVAGDPALELAEEAQLAWIGAGRRSACAIEIDLRAFLRARGFEEHPGEAGIDVGEHRVRIGVRRREDVGRLGLVAEKARDEIVDAREGRGIGRRHVISEGVLCHRQALVRARQNRRDAGLPQQWTAWSSLHA